jgi:GNAT superfamily N-acetyltransferase
VGVRLRPVREDELPAWLAASKREYADDLVENGGASREEAERKAEQDFASLVPGGKPGPEQALFVVDDIETGQAVGRAWLGERSAGGETTAFVWDVFLQEHVRGRGLGRRAMELLEDEARLRGHKRIRLNVFGGNEVARALYSSLGYSELAVFMGKDLA